MDASIPDGAAILLDFLADFESNGDYDIIYGNHQKALGHPITTMMIDVLLAAQKVWGRQWGSSAAGRYQIMQQTLQGLKMSLKLSGMELFSPDMQDRLAYQLLKQRSYASFATGAIDAVQFARKMAQEWASLPVLAQTQGAHRNIARGETFYAGDRLNRALVSPEKFEAILAKSRAAA